MKYRTLLLCAAAAAASACTKKNPEFCESNDECDTGFCDVSVNRCEEAPDADPLQPDAAAIPDAGTAGRLVVSLSGNGTGTVVSEPAGIDCPTVCEFDFAPGATITLTATPDGTSTFMGWSPCAGLDTCELTLDTGRNATANFGVSGEHLWSAEYGGSGGEAATSVVYDTDGNLIVAGAFNGSIDLGGGLIQATDLGQDIFVAKYTSAGAHVWSHAFGGPGVDGPGRIAVDPSGDVVLVGTLDCDFLAECAPTGSLLFSKLRAVDGNEVFAKTLPATGGGAAAAGAGVDGLGNIVIGGTWSGTLDLLGGTIMNLDAEGDGNIFFARYDNDGVFIRAKSYNSTAPDMLRDIAVAPDGTVYLTGFAEDDINWEGTTPIHVGGADIFIAKISSVDSTLWVREFGTTDNETGRGIGFDASGNVYATGSVDGLSDISLGGATLAGNGGTSDMWVASYAPSDGAHRWSKRFGTSDDGFFQSESGLAVAADARGNVTVVGRVFGPVDVGGGLLPSIGDSGDILIANYNASDGAHRWSYAFGGDADNTLVMDSGESVAIDAVGHIAVSGMFFGMTSVGGDIFTAAGSSDVFNAVYVP